MKNVGIVVVTYNRLSLLKECLIALLNQEYNDFKIFIIDNASSDGTEEYCRGLSNQFIFYKRLDTNIGGAGGFNAGIKEAISAECDYIWIMDDDCIVQPQSLSSLIYFAKENPNFGFLSSKVLWIDDSICKMNVQRQSISKEIVDFNSNQEIKLASFVSLFLRKETVIDIGLPIKEFFIWGDDLEYTSRISRKYKCYYVKDSVVIHKCNNNIGSCIWKDSGRINRYFYAYRNEKYLYKNVGFKGKVYYTLKIIYHFLMILLFSKGNKINKLKIMQKGLHAGKRFRPKIEYSYPKSYLLKVLEFFGEPLSYGGQEAFMINMYNGFEDQNIKYVFATPFYADNLKLKSMIEKRKDKLINFNFDFYSNRKKNIIKALKTILKNNKFDVIHIQTGSVFNLLECSKIAHKYGIKNIIAHSHCAGENNLKYKIIKKISDCNIYKYVNNYLACSLIAGEWKFPKNIINNNELKIIKNGIITEKYKFNYLIREKIRKNLKIEEDEVTFLHVGRFSSMKNHQFIVSLLPRIKELYPNFKFILIGSGELKEQIKHEIKDLNLINHFIFKEKIDNVNEVMMASDILLFPSLYEGFPMVLIEAQATGLISLYSDKITNEVQITNIITRLPLKQSEWINAINEKTKEINIHDRSKYVDIIKQKGYDAKTSSYQLEKIYRNI